MHCAWLEKPQLVPPLGYIAHQYAWAGMGAWIVMAMIASVQPIAVNRDRRVSDRGMLPWNCATKFRLNISDLSDLDRSVASDRPAPAA